MNGPVVSFDVSKGSSHMQGFLEQGKPLGKPTVISHDREGFAKINDIRKALRERTGKDPGAVYEHTGVYGDTLKAYLAEIGISQYPISPLESAKFRKAEIRPTKNDSRDCRTIADVFYSREISALREDSDAHVRLREMSRHYRFLLERKIEEKDRYIRCLDDVWPGFDRVLAPDSPKSLSVVAKLGHPSMVKSREQILRIISKDGKRAGPVSPEEIADRVVRYAASHVSGAPSGSYRVEETKEMAEDVKDLEERCEELMASMSGIASSLPEYGLLKTIPGLGDVTVTRIIAEIGDIGRYPTAKSLVAYCGLDPTVSQSGQMSGAHLNITKKGNSFLRATVYLAVVNMMKTDNGISRYVRKKKNSGLHYKAAVVAGANKLLRLIHAMLVKKKPYDDSLLA
jgi:transposase